MTRGAAAQFQGTRSDIMATFKLKPGDRKYALKYQLSDYASGSGLLTGASARFQMMDMSGTTVIDAAAEILDEDGIVAYKWADGDTDTEGLYRAEFKITFSDGLTQHYPSEGFIIVQVSQHVPDQ